MNNGPYRTAPEMKPEPERPLYLWAVECASEKITTSDTRYVIARSISEVEVILESLGLVATEVTRRMRVHEREPRVFETTWTRNRRHEREREERRRAEDERRREERKAADARVIGGQT